MGHTRLFCNVWLYQNSNFCMPFGKNYVQWFSSISHFIVKFAHFFGVTTFGNFLSKHWAQLINKNYLPKLTSLSCPLNPSGHFWWFSMCFFEYFFRNLPFSAPKSGKIWKNPFFGHMTTDYDVIWRHSSMKW